MFSRNSKTRYLEPGRLEDVLALIQVLGLDSLSYRSESGVEEDDGSGGLQSELQGSPTSAKKWTELAKQHPEFFRVNESKKYPLSLVCRHAIYQKSKGKNTEVPLELVQGLMQTAIELHERQIRYFQRWAWIIPVWVLVLSSLVALANKLWFSNCP